MLRCSLQKGLQDRTSCDAAWLKYTLEKVDEEEAFFAYRCCRGLIGDGR